MIYRLSPYSIFEVPNIWQDVNKKPQLFYLLVQNFLNGNVNELCAGSFTCNVSNVIVVFVIKALYISFWTFVLHALCDYGYKRLSWFLVLFPFILCAVLLGMLFLKEM